MHPLAARNRGKRLDFETTIFDPNAAPPSYMDWFITSGIIYRVSIYILKRMGTVDTEDEYKSCEQKLKRR